MSRIWLVPPWILHFEVAICSTCWGSFGPDENRDWGLGITTRSWSDNKSSIMRWSDDNLGLPWQGNQRQFNSSEEIISGQTVFIKYLQIIEECEYNIYNLHDTPPGEMDTPGNWRKGPTSMTSLCSEGFSRNRNSSSHRGFKVLFFVFVSTESTT